MGARRGHDVSAVTLLSRRRGVIAGITPPDPDPPAPGLMVVGVKSAAVNAFATVTIAVPEEVEEGDLLIARIGTAASASAVAVHADWDNVRLSSTGGQFNHQHRVMSRIATDSEPANYAFTNSDGNSHHAGEIIAIRNHNGIDIEAGATDTAALPALSPTVEDALLLGFWSAGQINQTATWTDPDDMTTLTNRSPNTASRPAIVSAWEQLEGGGDTPARTSTKGGSTNDSNRITVALVIAPEGGGAPVGGDAITMEDSGVMLLEDDSGAIALED